MPVFWVIILLLELGFRIGSAHTLAVTTSDSSPVPSAITLYSVQTSHASTTSTDTQDVSQSLTLTGIGTLSDGSATTYLEQEVEWTSVSGTATSVSAETTRAAIVIESASGFELFQSDQSSWRDVVCTFGASAGADCQESLSFVSRSTDSNGATHTSTVTHATSYRGSAVAFYTLTASPASLTSFEPTQTTSSNGPVPTIDGANGRKRNVVGRAVGGAVGGAILIALLALLLYILIRRHRRRRRRRRSPGGQYTTRSVPVASRKRSVRARALPTDTKEAGTPMSQSYNTIGAQYESSSGAGTGARPWTTESGSTFRDEASLIPHISPPTVPPLVPPRADPVAPHPPTRLDSQLRNRPSRFIEQLAVNSTDLNVLVAIAKAEAAQKQEGSQEEKPEDVPSSSGMSPPADWPEASTNTESMSIHDKQPISPLAADTRPEESIPISTPTAPSTPLHDSKLS